MRRRFPVLRKLLLLLGDIFVAAVALYITKNVGWCYGPHMDMHFYNLLLVNMVCIILLFNVNGLFSLLRKRYSEIFISLFVAASIVAIITIAISSCLEACNYPLSEILLGVILQFVLLAVWNYIFWHVDHKCMQLRTVLVVGDQEKCERIIVRLQAHSYLNDHVKYTCGDFSQKEWEKIEDDIDLVIICPDLNLQVKAEIVHFCYVHGKQVFLIPEFYELFCRSADLDKIDDIPIFRPRYLKPTAEQRFLKRLFDLVSCFSVLLLILPVMLIVAVAIKLDSEGPVIYSQIRIGRYRKEFKVYKFRTMRQNAEEYTGPVLAAENDPRITNLGNFLRTTRLDELPQLINVITGDMSIVGPRPERPFFVEKFMKEIPEYFYRYNVKPGITGLAQIYGKYNSTVNDKLIYDLIYIQTSNVIIDIIIMLQTLKVLLTKSSTEGVKDTKFNADLSKYQI